MAVFNVKDPSGAQYRVTAPDDATPAQLQSYVQSNLAKATPKQVEPEEPSIGDLASALMNSKAEDWHGVGKDLVRYGATAGQGLFGLADEAGAGIGAGLESLGILDPALGDPNQSAYDRRLANIRQVQKEFTQEHPDQAAVGQLSTGLVATAPLMSAKAAQIAGGLSSVPGVGRVVQGVQAIQNPMAKLSAEAALTGAPLGAITGFGSGEGVGDRLTGAAEDAALFGATGALVPPAMAVGGKVLGTIGRGLKAAGQGFGRVLEDWYAPERAAARQVGKALVADSTPINGVTPTPVEDVYARVQQGMTPAEAGGSNVEALMDAMANKPGPARPGPPRTERHMRRRDYLDTQAAHIRPSSRRRPSALRALRRSGDVRGPYVLRDSRLYPAQFHGCGKQAWSRKKLLLGWCLATKTPTLRSMHPCRKL